MYHLMKMMQFTLAKTNSQAATLVVKNEAPEKCFMNPQMLSLSSPENDNA